MGNHDTRADSRWVLLMLGLMALAWVALCAIIYGLYRLYMWMVLP